MIDLDLPVEHTAVAPIAYPELHHLTTPLHAHAGENGDAEQMKLWAGQAHELARVVPAGQLAVELARNTAVELDRTAHRLKQQQKATRFGTT